MPNRFLEGYSVLRNPNYRLFWMGHWVSLIGTWMQGMTQAWLLARLTDSPMWLGLLGTATTAPLVVLVLVGGLVSDRYDRRRLLLLTQALSMAQAAVLAALTISGHIEPWHIIALAVVMGVINAFDNPARQAFITDLVGTRQLPNAIALNSSGFNAARVVGPAIGGLLVVRLGEGMCFAINAASYLAVLIGLWWIQVTPRPVNLQSRLQAGAIIEGLHHAWIKTDLRAILLFVGVCSTVAIPYRLLLPDVARSVLGAGAWDFGLLLAAGGAGAMICGLSLAGLQVRTSEYRRVLPLSLFVFSIGLATLALSRRFDLSLLAMALTGGSGVAYFSSSNTLIQLDVSEEYRGRVLALYTLMYQGTAALGGLAMGAAASRWGTPSTFLVGSAVCLGAVAVFWRAQSAESSVHSSSAEEAGSV